MLRIDQTTNQRADSAVFLERGVAARLAELLAVVGSFESAAVLFDPAVAAVANQTAARIAARVAIAVAGGERAKTLERAGQLGRQLLDAGLTRRSVLVVVGGGSLTDLGGFVASIYLRGIACVLVPSTLLAMCDAAIGGKNGVDVAGVKNIFGTITAPRAVLIDATLLDTLPDAALQDGLVEVVKKGAMLDAELFAWLELEVERVLAREPAAIDRALQTAVQRKLEVVADDEREAGRRMLLNYGHTVGHGLETLSGFALSHGRAVAIGMVAESIMTGDIGVARRIAALLARMAMPTSLPAVDRDALWAVMTRDKKVAAGEVRVAVPDAIGHGRVRGVVRADLERIAP